MNYFDKILREPVLLNRFDDADCLPIYHEDGDSIKPSSSNNIRSPVLENQIDSDESAATSTNNWNCAHLMIAAFAEALCIKHEPSDLNRQQILREKIAKTLIQNGIISPICFSNQLNSLRERMRLNVEQLFENAKNSIEYEGKYDNSLPKRVAKTSESTKSDPFHHHHPLFSGNAERYQADFQEFQQLGKGGFGSVFKVYHRLDMKFYAVKKIFLDISDMKVCLRALREVNNLASLNHSNIVRYFSSWFEWNLPFRLAPISAVSQKRDVNVSNTSLTKDDLLRLGCQSSPELNILQPNDNFGQNHHNVRGTPERHVDSASFSRKDSQSRIQSMTLYVQMELCSSTLRDWLNNRNKNLETDHFAFTDKLVNNRILTQVLQALAYIHSQGIIHRDLKPSNIFLRDETTSPAVLLGDFGLSCWQQVPLTPDESGGDLAENGHSSALTTHSSGLGTRTYSAPEQLTGCFYDGSADMYSFGVVAYETHLPMRTDMERTRYIMNLRKGITDEKFREIMPRESDVICQLVKSKPTLRPTAAALLEEAVFNSV